MCPLGDIQIELIKSLSPGAQVFKAASFQGRWIIYNKANLSDLIAVTGLVIWLKLE